MKPADTGGHAAEAESGLPAGLRRFTAWLAADEERDAEAERWLGLLRLAWGAAYVVVFDEIAGTPWMAWRIEDDSVMFSGCTPQELNAALRADRPAGEIR